MGAVFSECGTYRYRLDRDLDFFGGPPVGFFLHNPSTADAESDDPTSRRGIGFARAWGASRLIFINVWAGRATKPRNLWRLSDPVGPENDEHIAAVAKEIRGDGGRLILAWGRVAPPAHYKMQAHERLEQVKALVAKFGCDVQVLGTNLDGSPKHPLYVRKDASPLSCADS